MFLLFGCGQWRLLLNRGSADARIAVEQSRIDHVGVVRSLVGRAAPRHKLDEHEGNNQGDDGGAQQPAEWQLDNALAALDDRLFRAV